MKYFLYPICIFLSTQLLNAQTFVKTGLAYSSDWTTSCLIDLNQDGYLDIFSSTQADNQAHSYLQNNGDGQFTQYLADFSFGGYAANAAWADLENDGDLDLMLSVKGELMFVFNNGAKGYSYERSYFNNAYYVDWVDADNNGLIDISSGQELFQQTSRYSFLDANALTLSGKPSWCDYDNDGDMDLLGSVLYKNDKGIFTNVTAEAFPNGYSYNGKTISWADYNNDGKMDVFVSANTEDILYKNNGDGTFSKAQLPNDYTDANSAAWADYDNDGDLDLFTATSLITPNTSLRNSTLYTNNHDGSFTIATAPVFQFASHESWQTSSCAWGDVNNDGKQDLVLSRLGWGITLYTNTNTTNNAWITLKLKGTVSNQSAIGAKVYLKANINGKEELQVREISVKNGGGQSSLATSFGLGNAAKISSIEVRWPSGIVNSYTNVNINQVLDLEEHGVTASEKNAQDKKIELLYTSTPGRLVLRSSSGAYELSIADITGKVVIENRTIEEAVHTITLEELPRGMYLLQVKKDNGYYSQLVVH